MCLRIVEAYRGQSKRLLSLSMYIEISFLPLSPLSLSLSILHSHAYQDRCLRTVEVYRGQSKRLQSRDQSRRGGRSTDGRQVLDRNQSKSVKTGKHI